MPLVRICPGCREGALHDVLRQQETRELLRLITLASMSFVKVKAAPLQAAKDGEVGPLTMF